MELVDDVTLEVAGWWEVVLAEVVWDGPGPDPCSVGAVVAGDIELAGGEFFFLFPALIFVFLLEPRGPVVHAREQLVFVEERKEASPTRFVPFF
ncbi:hypothetical protein ACFVH4_17850 [Nocardia ignorata]|uniref:hypothetical protein n=1 Tax=Nocardia ignorata TaxID=145285 RepID=UPI003627C301